MSEPSEKKRAFRDKITDKYRVVILDDDTLGEKKSMRFTLLGFLAAIITTLLLFSTLTYFILMFIRNLIQRMSAYV